PVKTMRESRGSSTERSLRLCSRAPRTTSWSCRARARTVGFWAAGGVDGTLSMVSATTDRPWCPIIAAPPVGPVASRSVREPLAPRQGLYDGAHVHAACGVGFVATLRGEPGHDIVRHALTVLHNLDHRGAVGAEADSGDGAGILTQLPDALLRAVIPVELPPPG